MKKKLLMSCSCMVAACLIGCQQDRQEAVNGTAVSEEVYDLTFSDTLRGSEVVLEEPIMGFISVYDSLLIAYHPRNPRYQYIGVNLKNGKLHAKYFPLGKGPNEFLNVTPILQTLANQKGEQVAPFVAINEFKYGLFNLDQSIATKRTVLDTLIDVDWKENYLHPFTYVFSLGDSSVIAKSEPSYVSNEEYDASPKYLRLDFAKSDAVQTYRLYDDFFNPNIGEANESILLSIDKMNAAKDKIAMAMLHLPQVNILDLRTGQVKSVRWNKSAGIEKLKNIKTGMDVEVCHKDLAVDSTRIYVLCAADRHLDGGFFEEVGGDLINVFDWEGNYEHSLTLDKQVDFIAIDQKNRLVYGINNGLGEVYQFPL